MYNWIVNNILPYLFLTGKSASISLPEPNIIPIIYLWITVAIFISRSLAILKKLGLSLIVSEIFAGIIIGNLHYFGINIFSGIEKNQIVEFLAELGAIILMFEIGLESNLKEVGSRAYTGLQIALIGTVITFICGYFLTQIFFPESNLKTKTIIGLILAATATGISGKVFKDLKIIHTDEAQTVLAASLIDEILSILSFAIITGSIIVGQLSPSTITISALKTLSFFFFGLIFGGKITKILTKWSIKIYAGISMKIGILFMLCMFFSWLAIQAELAPVVGGFIAGIIIDPNYFQDFSEASFFKTLKRIAKDTRDEHTQMQLVKALNQRSSRSLDELIKPMANIFIPIFFIHIGMSFKFKDLYDTQIITFALALVVIGFSGRILSGFLIHKKNINKLIIGLGMTPIGEAGLIFAATGQRIHIISDKILASIILAVIIITIFTPILIKLAISKARCHNV